MNGWLETGLIAFTASGVTLGACWLWIQVANWRLDRRARRRERPARR